MLLFLQNVTLSAASNEPAATLAGGVCVSACLSGFLLSIFSPLGGEDKAAVRVDISTVTLSLIRGTNQVSDGRFAMISVSFSGHHRLFGACGGRARFEEQREVLSAVECGQRRLPIRHEETERTPQLPQDVVSAGDLEVRGVFDTRGQDAACSLEYFRDGRTTTTKVLK